MKMHPLSDLFQFLRNLFVLYAPCIIFGRNGQRIIITVPGGLMSVGEGITTVLKPQIIALIRTVRIGKRLLHQALC